MPELRRTRVCLRRVFAVAVTALFALAACSSDDPVGGPPTTPASTSAVSGTPAGSPVRPVPDQPLPAGTYSSEVFATPVTYTVPAGWKMFEDEPGQFGLALVANDRPCVCFWRDVRAAAASCAEEPEAGVGASAADITTWLARHKGLKTTTPKAVRVGGLSGYVIDVAMDPAWTGQCDGETSVPTLVGTGISSGVHWGSSAQSSQRIYLLDLGEDGANGNIAINIEVCCGVEFKERTAAVTPIIDSLVFRS